MYRALVPEGEVQCADYEMGDHGVELFDEDDEFIGFVPFENLQGLMSEDAYTTEESGDPSVI